MKAEVFCTYQENGCLQKKSHELILTKASSETRQVENNVVNFYPAFTYQKITGFGGAMTEAAACTLSKLSDSDRDAALKDYFGEDGSGYSVIRTHIDSSDFALGMYQAVQDVSSDPDFASFSLKRDREYIIPAIKAAMNVSRRPISVMLSPWSPPAEWKTQSPLLKGIHSMEDLKKLFPPELSDTDMTAPNLMKTSIQNTLEASLRTGKGSRTCGGRLKPEYYDKWADYMVRYVKGYLDEGIPVRWLTIQNEAQAATPWDSCEWTVQEEKAFLEGHLYPAMERAGLKDQVGILFWDHNKENLVDRAMELLDQKTLKMVEGAAFHWYSGDHFEAVRMVQEQFPELKLILSECCCLYVPSNSPEVWAHARKYAHDIIGNLNAGMDTWFDWNLFLDEQGGPNHVGNYCSSPIMLDGNGGYEKRAPYYYIRQISGFIQPGAVRVGYSRYTDRIDVTAFRNPDGTIVGILLNCGDSEEQINLRIKGYVGELKLAPGGIASVLIQEQEKPEQPYKGATLEDDPCGTPVEAR